MLFFIYIFLYITKGESHTSKSRIVLNNYGAVIKEQKFRVPKEFRVPGLRTQNSGVRGSGTK